MLQKGYNWGSTTKQYRKRRRGGGPKNRPINLKKLKPFKYDEQAPYKNNYRRYIRSRDWGVLKIGALKRDGYKCTRCFTNHRKLNVHHKTYDRIFHEKLDDLVTLCNICHRKEHNLL